MANTYTLIASNTLTSNATSVTFSSIPGTYTDLVVRVSARNTAPGTYEAFRIEFNGSSTAVYSNTYALGNGSAASSGRDSNNSFISAPYSNGNGATSNTFSSHEIYIPSYTVSQNKPLSVFSATETNASTANAAWTGITAGLWRNTSAITQITFVSPGGYDYVSGSSFWLYGIKNS